MDEMLKYQTSDRCELLIDEEDESFWAVVGERIVTMGGSVSFLTAVLDCDSEEPALWITDSSIYSLLTGDCDSEELEIAAEKGIIEDIFKAPYQDEIAELFTMVNQKADERR
ncbi:MAG: hypothetical protein K6G51_07455 [Sphaerochaetaceae bacterium]|nr:hypothetical protein [Sphaerochaetaceae bacterium]